MSMPAADASVPTSPSQILLTFSEPPDPKLSLVKVVDSAGRPALGVGTARSVPGQPAQLAVPVTQPLPPGVYTVNWRSVSSTDGHVQDGAFAFGVGAAPNPGSVVKVSLLNSSPWASAAAVIGRWLLYIGLGLLVGGASTVCLVFGARLPRGGLWLLRAAVAAAALGVIVMIAAERALVGVASLLPLFVTKEGELLLGLAAAVVACGLAVAAEDFWPDRWSLAAVGATATAAVLLHVLAGHADAPAALKLLNLLEQWIHMTAIGVWTGGLAWLLLGIRGQGQAGRALAVRKFSRIATVTLVVVLVTGLLRSITEIGALSSLIHTSYGVTLLIKVGLVGVLVLFAAFNHFRFVPALDGVGGGDSGGGGDQDEGREPAERGDEAGRRFGLDSRAELVMVLAVLAATAVLCGLAPPNSAVASGAASSAHESAASGSDFGTTVRVKLRATPGMAGANAFAVTVDDYDTGKPVAAVSAVTLGFSLPSDPSVNASTLTLRRSSGGVWRGSGLELSIVGSWSVTVLIQEPSGGVDVPLTLQIMK